MSDITIQILLSICSGLIIISEILPFVKKINSNGIIHLLYNFISKKEENNEEEEENQPLFLTENTQGMQDTIIIINEVMNNINNLSNSTLQLINNSKQLKLQTSELYELNYIINYIKVNYPKKVFKTRFLTKSNKQLLISQGYIIDYDSEYDMYNIKW